MANMEYVNLGLKLGNMNAVGRYIYILLVVMVILPVDLFGSGKRTYSTFGRFDFRFHIQESVPEVQ